MRLAIAADHNGVALKAGLVAMLRGSGHDVVDLGGHGPDEVDYPPLCAELCRHVVAGGVAGGVDGRVERGIVVGGSGLGETVVCNKIRGIRAGLCPDLFHARISRGNNDSNVLVLGAKVVPPGLAGEIVTTWLETPFKGGVHQRRLDQIAAIERSQ
ncbi:RpiB/LacA/LacB family sugar-phosphate isomerase [Pseudonocardia adelaidensis]|uniref:Ribose 5-phosphate isomerase B n=1 Tax=Pseudonocardia adelaidensis TaxID=648754 RepID=A0ABP9NSC3_9PSEU